MITRREQITGPDENAAGELAELNPETGEIRSMRALASAPTCCHCKQPPPPEVEIAPLGYYKVEPKIIARTCGWTDPVAPQLVERFICSACVEKIRADPASDRYVKQARATGMELPG